MNVPSLTFPTPVIGKIKRPRGQGCTSCVHQYYCTTLYWYIRNQERSVSDDFGCACASWSDEESHRLDPKGEGDLYMNQYMNEQGIAQEKNQNGIDGL